ncbi:hypothetical protein NKI32_04065 [Mesorhizobium sp. M0761]|uniref:hypothetical protein n=1 Tax=Mesorhizobium sp. M0761 TaxID=2956994 RepID=UPI00333AF73B
MEAANIWYKKCKRAIGQQAPEVFAAATGSVGHDQISRPRTAHPRQATRPDWEHFYARPICGQRVDRRDFRQVMGHEQPDREPLELDQEAGKTGQPSFFSIEPAFARHRF